MIHRAITAGAAAGADGLSLVNTRARREQRTADNTFAGRRLASIIRGPLMGRSSEGRLPRERIDPILVIASRAIWWPAAPW